MEVGDRNLMRVAIMQDVLLQMELETLNMMMGEYLIVEGVRGEEEEMRILSGEQGEGVVPECRVCALGAVFVSSVHLFNQFYLPGFAYLGPAKMREHLGSYFTQEELLQIETFFEEMTHLSHDWVGGQKDKMAAICISVIANDGVLDWDGPVFGGSVDA